MGDRAHKSEAKANQPPAKLCATCGRTITWRKKLERTWDTVKFCSEGCRTHRPNALDESLETAILTLLAQRGANKTICPSEAAKAVAPEAWEPQMEPARKAARRLVARGLLDITQQGQIIDASTAKGPVRLRLRRNPA